MTLPSAIVAGVRVVRFVDPGAAVTVEDSAIEAVLWLVGIPSAVDVEDRGLCGGDEPVDDDIGNEEVLIVETTEDFDDES